MFKEYKIKINRKINALRCYLILKNQKNVLLDENIGYLTIFHDYEGKYAGDGIKDASYRGVTKILDIEKENNIKATYNIVAKLVHDVPEIVERIVSEEHEIASHSFAHNIICDFSRNNMLEDIKKSLDIFDSIGVRIKGVRSPRSVWSFRQMTALLEHGINWSAEDDNAKAPYILINSKDSPLIRMPITIDDWSYQEKNTDPEDMFKILMSEINRIAKEKICGAIGFHPWVQGLHNRRLEVFERIMKEVSTRNDIKIITFGQMYELFLKHRNN